MTLTYWEKALNVIKKSTEAAINPSNGIGLTMNTE
jgi:hypothetical protein